MASTADLTSDMTRQLDLVSLAWHVMPVTLISIMFVVVGVSFRTGWLL